MAKSKEKIQAINLRREGESIKDIAKKLKVSKSSTSDWCRHIKLTQKQITDLEKKTENKRYRGALKGARIQLERRLAEVKQLKKEGSEIIKSISKRDLLLIGAGLYWGEGTKQRKTRITNSDPKIIKFTIKWFKDIWKIPIEQLTVQVLINEIHQKRIFCVEEYWSKITKIPKEQFTKTTLIKSKNKKIYKNFNDHYGTFVITVRRGGNLQHKISGLLDSIAEKSE